MTSAAEPVLLAQNLTVRVQNATVLDDVSFCVQPGEYVGIVGPNGSGKTTLMRALLGLLSADSGTVRLFGEDAQHFSAWSRIGYLPQATQLAEARFPATVREVVATGLLVAKRFPRFLQRGDRRRVDEILGELGIAELAGRRIGCLSGGQRQRVLLARALVNRPELLILDEPVAALDPEAREHFYASIHHMNCSHGVTILLVSHDPATVGTYASKLLYLDRRVIYFGDFQSFCESAEMTAYFGHPLQHSMCGRHHG